MPKTKSVTLTVDGNKYTLAFDRRTAAMTEQRGFVLNDLSNQSATMIPILVRGAFIKHHKYLTAEQIDDLWEKVQGKDKLVEKLGEMYVEPIKALMGVDEEYDEKNLNWETN